MRLLLLILILVAIVLILTGSVIAIATWYQAYKDRSTSGNEIAGE
jgi:flagellar basal body-associated protein FliL